MGGLDADLGKILLLEHDIMPALVLEPFHDLVRGNLFLVHFRHLLILDRAQVGGPELTKTELLFPGRRINSYRNVNEAKADTALPDRTHSKAMLFTTPC